MKPIQEQEWRRTSTGIEMESKDGDAVGSIRVESNTVEDEAPLLAAVEALPYMVRALMRLYMAFPEEALASEEQADSLNGARAALKKAGVLP